MISGFVFVFVSFIFFLWFTASVECPGVGRWGTINQHQQGERRAVWTAMHPSAPCKSHTPRTIIPPPHNQVTLHNFNLVGTGATDAPVPDQRYPGRIERSHSRPPSRLSSHPPPPNTIRSPPPKLRGPTEMGHPPRVTGGSRFGGHGCGGAAEPPAPTPRHGQSSSQRSRLPVGPADVLRDKSTNQLPGPRAPQGYFKTDKESAEW